MERGITRHDQPTAPGGRRPQSSRDPRPTRSRRGVALRAIAALAAALSVFSVVSMATAQAAPTAPPPGSWIVTLQDGAGVDTVARSVGAAVRSRFTQALTAFSATLTEAQLARLEADPRVRSVTEDAVVAHVPRARRTPQAPPAPPSTQFVPEGVRRVGAAASPAARIDGVDQRLDADIAVIDTGVDRTHPDLNVTDSKDCTGEGITSDSFGHGTEVAGVAAARDNRIGTVGVAPGARLWNVRIFGSNGEVTLSSLLCGIDYVRQNAGRIDTAVLAFGDEGTPDTLCGISASRTGREKGRIKYAVVDPVDLALCRGTAAGVTFVASAGNDSTDARDYVPAAYPEVISVSAFTDTDGRRGGLGEPAFCYPTERDDTFASYSNFGRVVDLSAPGTCTYTTFPGNQYTTDFGTSFAAPHVAGAVALIKSRNPAANPITTATQLQVTKERGPIPGDPDGIPEGIVNVSRF